jgi:hypothetical protein
MLSIHARVAGTEPGTWADPSLVQLWGPRFSAYVVAEQDRAAFSLGRLPDDEAGRRVAEELAARLDAFLDGRTLTYGEAGKGLGEPPNRLRYAASTGRVLIRWEGARQPTIWTVPAPAVHPLDARVELARRYLHVFGPATADAFSTWAGISPSSGRAAFDALADSLTWARTPIGEAWILSEDEPTLRAGGRAPAPARLLPSGDAFFLLQGADRALLVPDPTRRGELWTPRVWPGAVLVRGEVVGTWRRSGALVSIAPWRRLSTGERESVEIEATMSKAGSAFGGIAERGDRVRLPAALAGEDA